MSYRVIYNSVAQRITVTLISASGASAIATIDRGARKTPVYFGEGENDPLHKLILSYSEPWTGENTVITYEVNVVGQGIDHVFNDNNTLYFDKFGESPFTIKMYGRNMKGI
ncbi:hypothetical protein FE392_05205 [Xenorhabdus sp. 12]|uniref:Uncharacterized protein n=1 Tax=Xenorhabdus santafensis TaxID=2582833 RepID=A0ABU4S6B2_9GAMM|nr:hypothetical protein [Xenorhabdus sp. 12]MDX7986734.1 hypothetical protein [Xenorhabdus sp. 12]